MKEMEALNQKSIERVVSQKAFQMGSSFPCQICVFGFLCGVCLTSLFLAVLTSFGGGGAVVFSLFSTGNGIFTPNSSSSMGGDCRSEVKERERIMYSKETRETDEKVSLLYKTWSDLLSSKLDVPEAPHLDNCKLKAK